MKIAVITPIRHLDGVYELLQTKGEVFMLEEGDINEVRELLIKENIDTILCNPNQQTYKIDYSLLYNTNVSTFSPSSEDDVDNNIFIHTFVFKSIIAIVQL